MYIYIYVKFSLPAVRFLLLCLIYSSSWLVLIVE